MITKLERLSHFARRHGIPFVTAQCWARQNTQGFEKACVVRIDGVTFVDTEAANAWLQRPRYPRTNLELKGQQEKGVPLVSAGEGNHD